MGLSASLARAMSAGPLDHGRGSWLVSARYGFLDLMVSAKDQPFTAVPRYHDGLAKVEWRPSPGHRFSVHALRSGDRFRYRSEDIRYDGRWDDTYAWTTWGLQPSGRLRAETTLSVGALRRSRDGTRLVNEDADPALEIAAARSMARAGIEQDWTLRAADGLRLSWGGSARLERASFDYARRNLGPRSRPTGPRRTWRRAGRAGPWAATSRAA